MAPDRSQAAKKLHDVLASQQLTVPKVWDKLFFVWAGAGEREQEIRMLVSQLGLASKVHVLGNRQDIADLIDASDIFVLPSYTEGIPLSIMEAMAKKMPVIVSAVGGIPEALDHAGILLPDPNVNKADAVSVLVAMIELLAFPQVLLATVFFSASLI